MYTTIGHHMRATISTVIFDCYMMLSATVGDS